MRYIAFLVSRVVCDCPWVSLMINGFNASEDLTELRESAQAVSGSV